MSFDDTTLTEINSHKHLGVILQNDCKWDTHIQGIISKVRLQVACLTSMKHRLSRKALETLYKSFILPHFDYADALWDNCTIALSEMLENINLEAIRTITGSVRGTSHHKLYKESGLIPLQERRRRHKLVLFFKMVKGLTPNYISNYIPPLITDINPYHRRNILNRYLPKCRTELYKQSFFPSTSAAWNDLPDEAKQIISVENFKMYLKSDDVQVPKFYYSHNRSSEIIHCRLRLEMSDLNADLFKRHLKDNTKCDCGYECEDAKHYLLDCPMYNYARTITLHHLSDFQNINIDCLLNGKDTLSLCENKIIFNKVHEFIELSLRFKSKEK